MKIEGQCDCGKLLVKDMPEGVHTAHFECECGAMFMILDIMERFGYAFSYGMEALAAQRFSTACSQFATAFEVFQKQAAHLVLIQTGVPEDFAKFLIYGEMDFRRAELSSMIAVLLHKRLPAPDTNIRNRVIHFGVTPKEDAVVKLGSEVLSCIGQWLKELESLSTEDLGLLRTAYVSGKKLPQEVAKFDRKLFDMEVTHHGIAEEWGQYSKK